jgi:hypothetical protein
MVSVHQATGAYLVQKGLLWEYVMVSPSPQLKNTTDESINAVTITHRRTLDSAVMTMQAEKYH